MHQNPGRVRRGRRARGPVRTPARPERPARARPGVADTTAAGAGVVLEGADVVVAGHLSAKRKDFAALMDTAEADLTARGARVVGRVVQRRGVSDGGVRKMHLPYSSRTLMSYGKVRELAALCERSGADAVVFLNVLTERQHLVLTRLLGCPAVSLTEAPPSAAADTGPHPGAPDSGTTGRP
ncbi:hypothetical protein O1Q96_02390 [Streptomyces sp. Qhu-G9]|uniref:hypothetical protein n=1 Tax=Streptomyces sp. Qhu-G9 TaxID=3452799 RepID=UPI0022AC77C8|nr:hypothetical protein [Streptomyces aurantiacus]WAU78704.1 hypothetical protein O1Q96_02390 [Streptomyces aurantiacus]